MPANIQRLAGQPIIVTTVTDPFDVYKELPLAEKRFREMADTIEGTVYRVIDISQWNIKFTDLVQGLAFDTREDGGLSRNARVHTVIVGSSLMARIGAEAAKQRQYGEVDQPIFGSMDEALAY